MATPPDFTAGQVLTAGQLNKAGLWIITPSGATNGTVTGDKVVVGNAVASVTVSGVFSADYDVYRIIFEGIDVNVVAPILTLRFGAATTDYYGSLQYDSSGGANGYSRANNGSSLPIGVGGQTNDCTSTFDVANPFVAKRTTVNGTYHGDLYSGWFGGQLANTNSYTAFTILTPSGSMTGGNIYVYGYNNG